MFEAEKKNLLLALSFRKCRLIKKLKLEDYSMNYTNTVNQKKKSNINQADTDIKLYFKNIYKNY